MNLYPLVLLYIASALASIGGGSVLIAFGADMLGIPVLPLFIGGVGALVGAIAFLFLIGYFWFLLG